MIKNIVLSILLVFMLTSCVTKEPIKDTHTLTLTIKSPYIKTSGNGFYRVGDNYTNLQLYSAGKLVINYESNFLTCINGQCLSKSTFNKNVFKQPHYAGLMDDILKSSPIYNSQNLQKSDFGFIQEIFKQNEYDIRYEIKEDTTSFVDRINNILIKIVKNKDY